MKTAMLTVRNSNGLRKDRYLLIAQCDSWLSDEELMGKLKKERSEQSFWKRLELKETSKNSPLLFQKLKSVI